MASRINTHVIETESRLIFANTLTKYHGENVDKGDLLFREITERDYGIDGQIELFYHGNATGKMAMVQIKGTQNQIEKLKKANVISCSGISQSNLNYCKQKNIPVILVYCSTANKQFYFIDLQPLYQKQLIEIGSNNTGTIHIPVANNSSNLGLLVSIINSYY